MIADHGSNPTDKTYAYALLPGMTSAQVSNYSAIKDVTILKNSSSDQGVKDHTLNVAAMNFWTDSSYTVGDVTSNKKASVVTKEEETLFEIAVSDPTLANNGSILIEIDKPGAAVLDKDPQITVIRLSPTIKFSVNVSGSRGKTFKAKFLLPDAWSPSADAYVRNGSKYEDSNFGSELDLAVKNDNSPYARKSYVKFDFSDFEGPGVSSALLRMYVADTGTLSSRTIDVYGNSNESWSENMITWNSAPAMSTYITSTTVSSSDACHWVEWDVTAYVQNQLADKQVSFGLEIPGAANGQSTAVFRSREDAEHSPKVP